MLRLGGYPGELLRLANTLGIDTIKYPAPVILKSKDDLSKNEALIKEILLKSSLVKIVLPKSKHSELIRQIKHNGISNKSLFPDVTGLAKSLYEIDVEYI